MVSLWIAIAAVLMLGLAWYLTWNAAWTAGHIWEMQARRALAAAERWQRIAQKWQKRAEELERSIG